MAGCSLSSLNGSGTCLIRLFALHGGLEDDGEGVRGGVIRYFPRPSVLGEGGGVRKKTDWSAGPNHVLRIRICRIELFGIEASQRHGNLCSFLEVSTDNYSCAGDSVVVILHPSRFSAIRCVLVLPP